ncbi:MAG: hypothetical protein ACLUI3_12870 [Christensenellales bacterium]
MRYRKRKKRRSGDGDDGRSGGRAGGAAGAGVQQVFRVRGILIVGNRNLPRRT